MKKQFTRAFTLIELLICISIIGMISAALAGMVTETMRLGEEAGLRGETQQRADAMLDAWARDVALAGGVEAAMPHSMTLQLSDAKGGAKSVRFAVDAKGTFARSVIVDVDAKNEKSDASDDDANAARNSAPKSAAAKIGGPAPLAIGGVSKLSFEPFGLGWRARLEVHRSTGRRDWTWVYERWATPLIAPAAGGAAQSTSSAQAASSTEAPL